MIDEPWHIDVLGQFKGGLFFLKGRTFIAHAVHSRNSIVAHLHASCVELPMSVSDVDGKEVFGVGGVNRIGVGAVDVV